MNLEEIKNRLQNHFNTDKVEVFDTRGTGDHFSIIVISDKFEHQPLIKRHQMIYNLFKNEITKSIHALQIQTYTKNEWKNKKI
tara:strand:+ start:150 stop:398 length:249 start_codon:yes stop_codon:yes gene_type:complete